MSDSTNREDYHIQENLDLIDDELVEQEAYALMYNNSQPLKET